MRIRAWSTVVAIAAATPSFAQSQYPSYADIVLTGGKIYTEDAAHSVVDSLAVKSGRILFVGSAAGAKQFVGPHTRLLHAEGRLVLPGLVDAHLHPTEMIDFDICDLGAKALSFAEISRSVNKCVVKQHIEPGRWVQVSQWEYAAGNAPDNEYPTLRAALDVAAPDNPVYMRGWDYHHGAYNSRALAMAKNSNGETVGFSKATLASDFAAYAAYIGVDANGEPSGIVNDQASQFIDSGEIERRQHARLLQRPELIVELINAAGITAIQDAAVSPNTYEVYDALLAKGRLTLRVNMAQLYQPEAYRDAAGTFDWNRLFGEADRIRSKYARDPLTRADAVKIFADGSIEGSPNTVPPTLGNSPRPVPYLQPIFARDGKGNLTVTGYVDVASPQCAYVRAKPNEYVSIAAVRHFTQVYGYHPGQCTISYGVAEHAPDVLNEYVKQAHTRGYTLHIHVIGETASTMAIDAIEAARAADGKFSEPDTLAHVEFATPADVLRMGKDRLYIVGTYSWAYAEPDGYDMSLIPFYNRVIGNSYEALHKPDSYFEQTYYPFKTALTAGAVLVAGSDAPVLTRNPQPFVNMEFAMTRAKRGARPTSPWQRLSIAEILDAYTINGAHALGRDTEIGSLEPGKSADFILVDRDILALAATGHADQIGDTHVLETWFQGKKVYGTSGRRVRRE